MTNQFKLLFSESLREKSQKKKKKQQQQQQQIFLEYRDSFQCIGFYCVNTLGIISMVSLQIETKTVAILIHMHKKTSNIITIKTQHIGFK